VFPALGKKKGRGKGEIQRGAERGPQRLKAPRGEGENLKMGMVKMKPKLRAKNFNGDDRKEAKDKAGGSGKKERDRDPQV